MDARWDTGPVAAWHAPEAPHVEAAHSADCSVECIRGRWVVWLDVLLDSGPVRRTVAVEHDERRARQSARIIERNVRRYVTPPPGDVR